MSFEDLIILKDLMFLSSITDAGDNSLKAVICVGGHHLLPRQIIGRHVSEIMKRPLGYTDAPYYELLWDRYFTFIVRDECSAAVRHDQEFVGYGVRSFTKSWMLATIPEFSNGLHEIPGVRGPVKHFGLYCANHIVDVLAYEEPVVRDLGRRGMEPENTPSQAMRQRQ